MQALTSFIEKRKNLLVRVVALAFPMLLLLVLLFTVQHFHNLRIDFHNTTLYTVSVLIVPCSHFALNENL